MTTLLDKYSPIYYLHNKEQYFPVGLGYYLQHGELVDTLRNERIKLDDKGIEFLYNYSQDNYPNLLALTSLWIETPKDTLSHKFDPETPIYGFIKETETTIDLYYVSLYAFNYGKTILGVAHSGDHEGDMEVIIIELKKTEFTSDNDRINRIYYGAHATEDGRWVKPEEVEFVDTTHPISYVASGGHGNYNKPGVVFRYFGLANDYVGRYIEWRPKVVYSHFNSDALFNPTVDGWLYFAGRWGFDGVSSIPDKGWMENKPKLEILKPPPIFSMPYVITARIIIYGTLLLLAYKLYMYGVKLSTTNKRTLYFASIVAIIAIVLGIVKYIVDNYA